MLSTQSAPSVTFAVDDVTPAAEPLPVCKPLEAVRALLDASSGHFGDGEWSPGDPTRGRVEACWSYSLDCVIGVGYHPLIAAAHLAYSQHRPLVLSPDVIWVTVVQGLAQHIRLDPERYRGLLVSHQGKHELTVRRDDLHRGSPESPWAEVIADFASRVHHEVGELAERLVSDFSTTGPVEKVVSQVALLDVVRPYFSFSLGSICGIPTVTLEGAPADWRKLREKVELLSSFELEWWLGEVRPICDQFVRAAEGDVDRDYWRRLYKIRAAYRTEVINGWLAKLFPYTEEPAGGTFTRRNDLLDPKVEAEIRRLEAEEAEGKPRVSADAPGIPAEDLPRGLSQVPFTLVEVRASRAMEFVAGSAAITQDRATGALRPTLGWAVREAAPIEQVLRRLAEHRLEPTKESAFKDVWDDLEFFFVPPDVLRFFQSATSAEIHSEGGGVTYRILRPAEWREPAWAQEGETRDNGERVLESPGLYRFAETADGTDLMICLYSSDDFKEGSVSVGRRDAALLPETGLKIARSFTEFLLRALDSPETPYFRQADFKPLDES